MNTKALVAIAVSAALFSSASSAEIMPSAIAIPSEQSGFGTHFTAATIFLTLGMPNPGLEHPVLCSNHDIDEDDSELTVGIDLVF
ncbi:hypothetical protein DRW07_06785 [Alteromonas sediminis]|uniref:Porin n=1 Tax=Alteromonas sediminis TaxID=2259342 RepID=A0A3N5Y2J0_9ALTE|nr:hypothetical protein [Alteromonas sediminis]RPJ67233.1 hypothetical protein DRW07_06785 [Alteromonas sediminis]